MEDTSAQYLSFSVPCWHYYIFSLYFSLSGGKKTLLHEWFPANCIFCFPPAWHMHHFFFFFPSVDFTIVTLILALWKELTVASQGPLTLTFSFLKVHLLSNSFPKWKTVYIRHRESLCHGKITAKFFSSYFRNNGVRGWAKPWLPYFGLAWFLLDKLVIPYSPIIL